MTLGDILCNREAIAKEMKVIFVIDNLGATWIEKIPKISASGQNFLDPLSLKKGLTTKTSVFRT